MYDMSLVELVGCFNKMTSECASFEALSCIAEKIIEKVEKIYENCSLDVDALIARRQKREREQRKWDIMRMFIEGNSPYRLLDCGFGSGRDLLIAFEKGFDAYGCEFCKKYCDDFVWNYPQYSTKVVCEDMREMSFGDVMFDVVRHNASFLHFPLIGLGYTVHKVLQESWRVLKPGGALYIYTKAGEGFSLVDTGEGFGARPFQFFTKEKLSQVLIECGFSIGYMDVEEKERVVRNPNGFENRQKIQWIEAVACKVSQLKRLD